MPRPGITKAQVFEAAEHLTRTGHNPTVMAIRAHLGSGSPNTIGPHLTDWKAQHDVSYPPKLSVSEMVRFLKGRSSRKLQEEFPQLGKVYWGKHFWAIGYAAFSAGHVTDEMIQEYLDHHDKHPNHNDDEFRVE